MAKYKTSIAESKLPEIISYNALRRAVGYIGVLLPIALILGALLLTDCWEIQGSISKYYHTVMQNLFVGALCAVALFLWAYRGYKKEADDKKIDIGDDMAGNLAALFALGVAFCPTYIGPEDLTLCINKVYLRDIVGVVHLVSALLFFLTLAYFSIVLFTKGRNQKRKLLYYICGSIILLCISAIVIYILFLKKSFPQIERFKPIFCLETIALVAFGISWLVKGKMSEIVSDAVKSIMKK